jgi:hypothetical protein
MMQTVRNHRSAPGGYRVVERMDDTGGGCAPVLARAATGVVPGPC